MNLSNKVIHLFQSKRVLIVIGAVICGLSYVLLGPAPFLPKKLFPRYTFAHKFKAKFRIR